MCTTVHQMNSSKTKEDVIALSSTREPRHNLTNPLRTPLGLERVDNHNNKEDEEYAINNNSNDKSKRSGVMHQCVRFPKYINPSFPYRKKMTLFFALIYTSTLYLPLNMKMVFL